MCGELSTCPGSLAHTTGSSPRVRGTRLRGAGRRPHRLVHPRVCGELCAAFAGWPCGGGSSPRVRGTQRPFAFRARRRRFIPACAGNSTTTYGPLSTLPVHPRVCGELITDFDPHSDGDGSSPRVRGTPRVSPKNADRPRFIPACAGNSRPPAASAPPDPVHPRVCGELAMGLPENCALTGSSPRVRGTRAGRPTPSWRPRFIPACAGNSPRVSPPSPSDPVHPRVCGELAATAGPTRGSSGSSPRVRGTRTTRREERGTWRFIPACAGNSAAPT